MEKYYLQNRWKLQGKVLYYYGLRNKSVMFRNRVKLNRAQIKIIKKLPCDLSAAELKELKNLAVLSPSAPPGWSRLWTRRG